MATCRRALSQIPFHNHLPTFTSSNVYFLCVNTISVSSDKASEILSILCCSVNDCTACKVCVVWKMGSFCQGAHSTPAAEERVLRT